MGEGSRLGRILLIGLGLATAACGPLYEVYGGRTYLLMSAMGLIAASFSFWLGRAWETKGDYPRAAAAYNAALQVAPQMNDAKVRLDSLRDKIRP